MLHNAHIHLIFHLNQLIKIPYKLYLIMLQLHNNLK